MFHALHLCRLEVDSIRRVAGPAGTLLGLSAAALLLAGVVARFNAS